MTDDSTQFVWAVLRLDHGDDENDPSLTDIEIYSTEDTAKAAAEALVKRDISKTAKKAPKVETVEDSDGQYDSAQSWTWTLKDQQDKFHVQILKKVLKTGDDAQSASKVKGKRKAKEPPKDSKSSKAAKSDAADPEPDDGEAPKKVPVRQRPGVISDGKPDCLQGFKLVFTGTFNSMDRKGCTETAEMYGATIVSKLKDADYIILGTKPGPKKVDEINQAGLKTMSEDEFLNVLKTGEMP